MEINTYGREDVNAGTPPIAVIRSIVSLAATKKGRRHLAVHDVHVAFFHADLDEWIVVIPPPGVRRPGYVWQLRKAMYGTRKAAQAWQEYVAWVFKKNGWIRIAVAAGVYYHPGLNMISATHGDDTLTEGEMEALDILDQQLMADMDVKPLGRVGPDGVESILYLKRTIRWTGAGFAWIGDNRHVDKAVEALGLSDAKPAETPGSRATGKSARNAAEPLSASEAKVFQSVAGLVNFIAVDRPDIQFAVKGVLGDMVKPLQISMLRLKRIVRYLRGRRELCWIYKRQSMPTEIVYETDSDWADDELTRKSTSSVYGYLGRHLIETQVASQPVVALSSGEAEFYAIGRGAASAIMIRQFLGQCDIKIEAVIRSDSSAGRAIATRIGSGKLRHLHIRDLWIQERVRARDLRLERVSTEDNTSDLGTKHLDRKRMNKLMSMANLQGAELQCAVGVIACVDVATALGAASPPQRSRRWKSRDGAGSGEAAPAVSMTETPFRAVTATQWNSGGYSRGMIANDRGKRLVAGRSRDESPRQEEAAAGSQRQEEAAAHDQRQAEAAVRPAAGRSRGEVSGK